jgi:hypothetical protein
MPHQNDPVLDEHNFILFAAASYDNPGCYDTQEFLDDLKRFRYLKKLFKSYTDSGELKTRIILNHIMILFNVFGPAATRMLFFKLQAYHPQLKPFVELLGYLPETINICIDGKKVVLAELEEDSVVREAVRNI